MQSPIHSAQSKKVKGRVPEEQRVEWFVQGQSEFALGSLERMHTSAAPMLCAGVQMQHLNMLTMYAEADL